MFCKKSQQLIFSREATIVRGHGTSVKPARLEINHPYYWLGAGGANLPMVQNTRGLSRHRALNTTPFTHCITTTG